MLKGADVEWLCDHTPRRNKKGDECEKRQSASLTEGQNRLFSQQFARLCLAFPRRLLVLHHRVLPVAASLPRAAVIDDVLRLGPESCWKTIRVRAEGDVTFPNVLQKRSQRAMRSSLSVRAAWPHRLLMAPGQVTLRLFHHGDFLLTFAEADLSES